MRVLVFDPKGIALDFAMRCQNAGHDVKVWMQNHEKTKYIGQGMITRVDDFQSWMRWADLVFMSDNTLHLHTMDAWRKQGKPIVGPSLDGAAWELDRQKGMEVLRKAGVPVADHKTFTDYDAAIAYVKKEDRRFVSKPSGDVPDKSLSYCSKSPEDMVYMLQRWKKLSKLKTPFIMQEFIDGVEMAVGGFFGPGGFNAGWCENWEFKKLMDGDLGVATGEQGTVLRFVQKSKLARKVLQPVTDALLKLNYVGYIDVNCIVDDAGTPWPLEFTTRPGWPTFNIQQALHDGDPAQWLLDLATGIDARNFRQDEIAIGVVLSIPDYPYSHLTRKEVVGIPVYGLKPSLLTHIHPCEMMMAKAIPMRVGDKIVDMPHPATAGDYILVMSATGATVLDAKNTCYRRLKRLAVPNSPMYRTDIGDRLSKQLPRLQSNGFANLMQFSTPAPN